MHTIYSIRFRLIVLFALIFIFPNIAQADVFKKFNPFTKKLDYTGDTDALDAVYSQPGVIVRVTDTGANEVYNPTADTNAARGTALQDAKTDAVSGDTIFVGAGVYDTRNLLKHGVNYWFSPGAEINYTANPTLGAIFDDGPDGANGPVNSTIGGYGRFIHNGAQDTKDLAVMNIVNGSNIVFHGVQAKSNSTGAPNNSALVVSTASAEVVMVMLEEIYSEHYDALILGAGTGYIKSPLIRNNQSGGDAIEGVNGTWYVEADLIHGEDAVVQGTGSGTLYLKAQKISGGPINADVGMVVYLDSPNANVTLGGDVRALYGNGTVFMSTEHFTFNSNVSQDSGFITTLNNNSLGVTHSDSKGLALVNNTDAAAGAQQISPALRLRGEGWKTNATAASQTLDWAIYNLPVQGTAAPTSKLMFTHSTNGGAYGNSWQFTSAGLSYAGSIGSASAPSYSFSTDTSIGMYAATNTIGFAVAGTERMKCTTTECSINDGSNDNDTRIESNDYTHAVFVDAGNNRVGILNSAPTVALDVSGDVVVSGIGTFVGAGASTFGAGVEITTTAKLIPQASPPGSPAAGHLYVDSTPSPDALCFYNGTDWDDISTAATDANCA